MSSIIILLFCFFFNDTATTEIYTLSLHDALPICTVGGLAGTSTGTITDSTASGAVTSTGANSTVGGLVGTSAGTIANSTASGAVTSTGANSTVNGLVESVLGPAPNPPAI